MIKKTSKHCASTARSRVAREAATLLYFGMEKEYRQAKLKAAANIGVHVLPSNLEVALELDKIAQETEGSQRTGRLIQMRKEALTVMKALAAYCPILIGSVWRGTIYQGSDVDIETFHDVPEDIVTALEASGLKIQKTEQIAITEKGKTGISFHIHAESIRKYPLEITVRSEDEKGKKRKCDTFGDEIKGLTIQQLEKLLNENSSQQFLPA